MISLFLCEWLLVLDLSDPVDPEERNALFIGVIFCRSGKIISNGLLLNHRAEAYFLDVAGDDS